MNIINKLTLRHLKENKRRTLITIIGVIISTAMLTAVSTLAVSFMVLLQKQEIADNGEWHALYRDVNEEQLADIHADQNTETVIVSKDVGYSYLKESENNFKPYLFFRAYNQTGFEKFPVQLIEGRMPANEKELLISEHIASNGQVEFEIGDTLTLDVGVRVVEGNDQYLDQSRPLRTTEDNVNVEALSDLQTKQYTIVGIMERPMWEPFSAPGYTVLTHLSESYLAEYETVNASVIWNKVSRSAMGEAEQLAEKLGVAEYSFNNGLLRYHGLFSDDNLRTTFFSLVAIIMTVIVIGSVSLIYNAFAISVSERSRHLGMLSSVGATKKQKRNSVFFEGAVIGLISIPLGVISGVLGIGITFQLIEALIQDTFDILASLTVVVTPMSIFVSCAVSLLTIFISTYIPAKRASKISAIDAIRQTQDIKMTRKEIKTNRLVRKIFGIEAEFGLKNLKRNKRRYQVVVFSLVVSIVLFLTVSFFTDQIRKVERLTQSGLNYDIEIASFIRDGSDHPFSDEFISSVASLEEITGQSFMQEIMAETTLNEDQLPAEANRHSESAEHPTYIRLYVLDEESLEDFAEDIGVDYHALTAEDQKTGIIINKTIKQGKERGEQKVVEIDPGETLELTYYDWHEDVNIPLGDLEIIALTDHLPLGVEMNSSGELKIIISEETYGQIDENNHIKEVRYALNLTSSDPLAVHEELEGLRDGSMYIYNYHKTRQEEEQNILLISIFIYGFITLITAISVANIFNTISTSVSLRKKEFAMLKSVGMTPRGFNKMINYESVFYGIKSLLYGLPTSLLVMYMIYNAITDSFDYPFELPWLSILYTMIGVFAIVGLAMLYSSSKVKKQNIIDGLKQENI